MTTVFSFVFANSTLVECGNPSKFFVKLFSEISIMFYVYILESESCLGKFYTGFTTDLKTRLKKHNNDTSGYTAKFRPWIISWYCAFNNEKNARKFELYLKTGSGRAFIKRHI